MSDEFFIKLNEMETEKQRIRIISIDIKFWDEFEKMK